MAQVVAEEFGVSPDSVIVQLGDTRLTPFATGTHGSKLTTILANAVLAACDNAKKRDFRRDHADDWQREAAY